MTIGLLAIMLDEAEYLTRWVEAVRRVPGAVDSMVVVDGGSADGTPEYLRMLGVQVVSHQFAHHFADQRNFAATQIEADWIFEVDADEIPSAPLLAGLRGLVAEADGTDIDCVGIPRLNFLDNVLVAGPGHKGLDYQYRLHRKPCEWKGAIHEEIVGHRARRELPIADGLFLIHDKSSIRHAMRNEYYTAQRASAIGALYRTVLGREPDSSGMTTYLKGHLSIDEIQAALMNSDEAKKRGGQP